MALPKLLLPMKTNTATRRSQRAQDNYQGGGPEESKLDCGPHFRDLRKKAMECGVLTKQGDPAIIISNGAPYTTFAAAGSIEHAPVIGPV